VWFAVFVGLVCNLRGGDVAEGVGTGENEGVQVVMWSVFGDGWPWRIRFGSWALARKLGIG